MQAGEGTQLSLANVAQYIITGMLSTFSYEV